MALPLRRARPHAVLTVLALALAGCGGVPTGPVLPEPAPAAPATEDAKSRSAGLVRMAETALRSGEAETAAGLFEQATLADTGSIVAAVGLGNALLATGRDLEASQAFERALAIAPGQPAAVYGYARAMIAIRRPEVAAAQLEVLVAQNPSSVEALNALGVAQDMLGEHAAATATYRRALAVMPASASVRNNLALSLALQEQFGEAVELLRPLAEGPGATRRARQNLALVYGLGGDMAAAERLGRVDLGGEDLANNLAYIAAVRGLEPPTLRAAALAPDAVSASGEPRLTRRSRPARQGAAQASPASIAPPAPQAPAAPPSTAPIPLVPILSTGPAAGGGSGGWFLDIGELDRQAAAQRWRDLRARHPDALADVGRLASAGSGPEPLLLGPLASEQAAQALCLALGSDAEPCRPLQL